MSEDVLPLIIACPRCHAPLALFDLLEQTAETPRLEFYTCQADGCSPLKFAVYWERGDGLGPPEPGFVDREVARRGAFFPSDYQAGQRGPRNW